LIRQFEQNYPEYYHLKYDIQTVRIEALQQKLSKEQILIEYFIGEKYIYLFGISQNHFEVIRQEKPSNFTQLIKNFNKGLNRTMFQKYAKAAHELYQILLAPILQHPSFNENYSTIKSYKHSAINQLIIIPHDVLSAVPFEALLCSLPKKNSSLQYADLDYLLLHYDVVYHYSATLWWQSQKKEKKRTLKDNFVGFAPVYQDKKGEEMQELAIAENGVRSVRIGEKDYTALLYSEAEVNGIKAAFEAQELPHSTFLHEEATKSNFEVAVKGKKYVLIAAHGFYNKAQPELSGIIFSPTETDNSEEAILYVNDAYHLDLKETDLVVLSACESGIGKLAKGEGIMAVNRGFLYSGANNVIFTLFKVYDEQSSELTQALFRYILEGKKYAQALRLAKLDLIQQPDTDPKSWAGFVMIGG
ncbi:MAG: CHAT domain-containing protein, partial [Chitinophagales bacterium]